MMPLGARRTFRLASVIALSLALAYGFGKPLPFFAPLFAILLTAAPAPPMGLKGLCGLCLVVIVTLGVGLLLTPLLGKYPASALLIIAAGLYFSTIISVGLRKALVGALLTMGFTLIPAAGLAEYSLAVTLIKGLVLGIAFAIASQWVVYPFFPEDPPGVAPAKPAPVDANDTHWIALRCTLTVLVPVMLAFTNPALYLPTIMKSVLLAQHVSTAKARSTVANARLNVLAGLFAILFWFALKLCPNLWMFFLLMLLSALVRGPRSTESSPADGSGRLLAGCCRQPPHPARPAVEDSANGKDVYKAFAVRFSLFIAVTLYAGSRLRALEMAARPPRGVLAMPATAG
jgi:hypothetical protein